MNESKFIKILVFLCIGLSAIGGLIFLERGWVNKESSLADVLNLSAIRQVSFLKLLPEIAGFYGERAYLLLFQNNLELRPSGGYLGNFGIIKVKNGKLVAFEIHDTNIFDGFGRIITEPPQPLKDHLHIDNWQMRDGNWSPDFQVSAKQTEYFYRLQGGQEKFNGIIGINAAMLPDLLELTGPVYLQEFDKEFKSEDVLYELEYEIEKGYVQRNIDTGERKKIFKALVKEILEQIIQGNLSQKNEFKNLIIKELDEKNILLYLKNASVQETVSKLGWGGRIDKLYQNDYLMLVEANLAAKKSNAFIKREVEYSIDLTKKEPEINLKIKYLHQGNEKNWFNDDYRFYLRVYVPLGSWLTRAEGMDSETEFAKELNKMVFANWIEVPVGQEKTIEFTYTLPERINQELEYRILVQKQSGIDSFPFRLILKKDKEYIKEELIVKDWEGAIFFEE